MRTFHVPDLPALKDVVARKRARDVRVSVGIPALDEQDTIAPICREIVRLADAGLVDQAVVIDGGSTDDTVRRARVAGADVVDARSILPRVRPSGGKGDSLWRSLAVLDGDIVCWVDADIRDFDERFITRLVAPLLLDEQLAFVKGFYRRPLQIGEVLHPTGGGRVTEMTARPLLMRFFPELAGFRQPLAGEYAGWRDVLERVPFFSGYSVEVGLLIDLLHGVGANALAQADLEVRVHRNRSASELQPMAAAIAHTILRRAQERGRARATLGAPHPLERELPPFAGTEPRRASQR